MADLGTDLGNGPLTGIRVIDLTVAVQGPHAGAYLSDMGADVIKVERPGGELNRYVHGPGFKPPEGVIGTQFVAVNRNKRGVVLDINTEVGLDLMHRMIAGADVFITNYRRDALDRMHLGYAELAALNPRLIWARVSGFGHVGPDAEKAMLDGAAQARGGLSWVSGPADGPPMPPGAAIADHAGAQQLTLGILTALFARERTGRGQQVNTSSLGSMMWLQAWEICQNGMSAHNATRAGVHHPTLLCPYGVYETADGGFIFLAVAMSDESWDDFWIFAERPEVVANPLWNTVAKRVGGRASHEGVEEIRVLVTEAFKSHTTAEWTEFLYKQPEIIWERVQSYDELFEDPQVHANGYLTDVDVPGFGTAKVVTNVVQLSDTPGCGVRRRAPEVGEHTAEIMTELGFDQAAIDKVLAQNDGMPQALRSIIFEYFD